MKNKENNNYNIIYKAENIHNGKVYIGATSKNLEARKKDHLKKSKKGKCYAFQNAISTYGAEAFTWSQMETASSTDELAKMEKSYVLEYNSKEEGYNSDSGGGIQKTVYQYDLLTGKLVAKHPSLSVAGAVVNANKQDLSSVCLNVNKVFRGFYWSYDYIDTFLPLKDLRRKKVQQFNLEGEFINEFNSVSEASSITGFNKTSIAKVCRGTRKQCGTYVWKYI